VSVSPLTDRVRATLALAVDSPSPAVRRRVAEAEAALAEAHRYLADPYGQRRLAAAALARALRAANRAALLARQGALPW